MLDILSLQCTSDQFIPASPTHRFEDDVKRIEHVKSEHYKPDTDSNFKDVQGESPLS